MSETADVDVWRDGWTAEADAWLTDLLAQGTRPVEIGHILNCSRQMVWNRRAKLNLPCQGRGGPRVHAQPSATYRICLCCHHEFRSAWIGNRLCIECKKAA